MDSAGICVHIMIFLNQIICQAKEKGLVIETENHIQIVEMKVGEHVTCWKQLPIMFTKILRWIIISLCCYLSKPIYGWMNLIITKHLLLGTVGDKTYRSSPVADILLWDCDDHLEKKGGKGLLRMGHGNTKTYLKQLFEDINKCSEYGRDIHGETTARGYAWQRGMEEYN